MDTFLILTPGFPKDENDTTCLPAFQQFALSLKKLYPHIEFYFIAFQYPFFKDNYNWHNVNVISIGGKNKAGFYRFYTWIRVYRVLSKLKKEKKIIGILSLWLTECSLIGKIFSKLNNIKHFMWLIGQDAKISNQYIFRIKPKANEIIAMSDFLQDSFFKNHRQKPFIVIENGINPNAFPEFNLNERKIDILGVGSLIDLKNYDLFIDIVFELQKTKPLIYSVIAGSGEREHHLKQKVKELKLENNIHFMGLVSHSEILNLMNDSKIFLHTSHYEGNSTVLMEALYSGCITFSTQALSNSKVKNLFVLKQASEFISEINIVLQNEIKNERVIFNMMDTSAKKIMDLYLTKT